MEAGQRQADVPAFLSTHPSGATCMRQLQQWMPEALQYYQGPGRDYQGPGRAAWGLWTAVSLAS